MGVVCPCRAEKCLLDKAFGFGDQCLARLASLDAFALYAAPMGFLPIQISIITWKGKPKRKNVQIKKVNEGKRWESTSHSFTRTDAPLPKFESLPKNEKKKTYPPEHPINIPSNVNNIFFPEFLSLAFYFYWDGDGGFPRREWWMLTEGRRETAAWRACCCMRALESNHSQDQHS